MHTEHGQSDTLFILCLAALVIAGGWLILHGNTSMYDLFTGAARLFGVAL